MEYLTSYWLSFVLMRVAGAIVTFTFLHRLRRKVYPTYFHEGFFSVLGMVTGTIRSGMLLLLFISKTGKRKKALEKAGQAILFRFFYALRRFC